MKLYEINERVRELVDSLDADPETGEVLCDVDTVLAELDRLEMGKSEILQYLAKMAINCKAEAEMLKAEEDKLKARRDRMDSKHDRLVSILDRECNGQKVNLGVASLCYRKSSRLDVSDGDAALAWLETQGHTECIKYTPPAVYKSEVTKLVKAGNSVPGCEIVTENKAYLRRV